MASSFTLRYSGSIIPYEIVTLADTTTTLKALHSVIDTSIGASIEKTIGDTSTFIKYMEYTSTASAVPLNDPTIFNASNIANFLAIKIVGAGSSGTPNLQISFDGGSVFSVVLSGIGDICIIPLNSVTFANIQVKSIGATTLANVVIMVAEEA